MFEHHLRELVRAAITEDIGPGDLTSLGCLEPDMIKAVIVAKSSGILSGLEPAILTFTMIDSANKFIALKESGNKFEPGETIIKLEGLNQTLLAAERAALNFLAHLSGVATLTRQFVEAVKGTNCKILDTRKTTPGFRMLEKRAVAHGGGINHRLGLYDMVLIKDNHIAACGSITEAVRQARDFLNSSDFRLQFDCNYEDVLIEVEVTNDAELTEAIENNIDRVLLDNQTPESLKKLVAKAHSMNPAVKLEASGNITLANAAEIAATGVDFISIGALTHSAPVSDFSMKVIK
jgi:nicotinate-nucleotide pyrophosphorylase (carboxylating)